VPSSLLSNPPQLGLSQLQRRLLTLLPTQINGT
jgi:hypothetical protein